MFSKRLLPPRTLRRTIATVSRLSDKTQVPKICSIDEAFPPVDNNENRLCFDEILDVRTRAEYEEDHIIGSRNVPVLNEDERSLVGKLHAKDKFQGHKTGAALISGNISRILEDRLTDKPASYSPLIYCWRGGLRSHSLALVLANIGFDVVVLEGGHKKYRERVRGDLQTLPSHFDFRVISGPTGSGKSALLRRARSHAGAQVLDLEYLAKHKGSVLGRYPEEGQPPQKLFESLLWHELRNLDASKPVWVESESKRIGNVNIPEPLFEAMKTAPRVDLLVPMAERVRHTIRDYEYFIRDPALLLSSLATLSARVVPETRMEKWRRMIGERRWQEFVESMLVEHYDPTYGNSQAKNSAGCVSRRTLEMDSLDSEYLDAVALPRLLSDT